MREKKKQMERGRGRGGVKGGGTRKKEKDHKATPEALKCQVEKGRRKTDPKSPLASTLLSAKDRDQKASCLGTVTKGVLVLSHVCLLELRFQLPPRTARTPLAIGESRPIK